MAPPMGLEIQSEADAMNVSGEQPPLRKSGSFDLSATGTFRSEDFRVGKDGLGGAAAGNESERLLHGVKIALADLDLLEELGQGASGIVRKAMHKPTGAIVAVKTVNITDKGKRSQMVNELKSLTSSQCPYLVSLHDGFYEDMQVHMVLEFMDGGDLSGFVQATKAQTGKGIMQEEILFKIAQQVLSGLSYLHRKRHQVHRDMKPANLMLTKDGHVKISDFGISSELDSTMGMCNTFVGTANYMSPERLSGGEYSYPSDIWSFGLILLECILGEYPYPNASNYFQLLNNILEGDVPTVPEDAPLSDDLKDFVRVCLHKDPAKRPTVTELQAHPWMKHFDADEMDLSMKLEDIKL